MDGEIASDSAQPAAEPEPPRAIPSIVPLLLVAPIAILVVVGCARVIGASQPHRTTVEALASSTRTDGFAVILDGGYDAVSLGTDRSTTPPGHYVAFTDASSDRAVVVRLLRTSGGAVKERGRNSQVVTGNVVPLPDDARTQVLAKAVELGITLGSDRLMVRDGETPAFPVGTLLLAVLAGLGGVAFTLAYHGNRKLAMAQRKAVLIRVRSAPLLADPMMPSDTAVTRTREAAYEQAVSLAPCGVCGAMVQGFMKLCPTCKIPRQIEYFASASLPLIGFEKYSTLIMRTLGESEYQTARSLARPHMPIPFSQISSLKERYHGGQSDTVHRLLAKGASSFLAVQSLKDELGVIGVEVVVVSSEELARAARPVVAASAATTLEGMAFGLEEGGAMEARWEDVSLIVIYGEESTSETLTRGGMRDSSSSGPHARRNMLDLYTRSSEAAIRIYADRFSWEVLKEKKAAAPDANFGRFIDLLEGRCPEAVFHSVTDTHPGAWNEWRANYYSMWRALVSRRGADKGRGVLAVEGYRILQEVGKGAWGRVYKAVQDRVERTVAIKVLSSQFPRDEKFRERFFREARTAGSLNHPNIVAVIDCNEQRGLLYLVMEYVEGTTLREVVRVNGPLAEPLALRAAKAVARALDHAHGKSIIHRDIKPENVFLSKDGHVKVGDWGLAKSLGTDDPSLTETGAALGTPNYISPEQVKALKDLDGRVDVYSLGAMLYFLLTGTPPFQANTAVEIMTKHLKEPPPDVRTVNATVSAATAELIKKAMSKDRDARFLSAHAMLDAMERIKA